MCTNAIVQEEEGVVAMELIRIGIGLADLLAPDALGRAELGRRPDEVSRGALKVLGARQVVQGALTLNHPSRAVRRFAGAVDLLHAGSMVLLAWLDPARRRGALVQAGLATSLGVAELRASLR